MSTEDTDGLCQGIRRKPVISIEHHDIFPSGSGQGGVACLGRPLVTVATEDTDAGIAGCVCPQNRETVILTVIIHTEQFPVGKRLLKYAFYGLGQVGCGIIDRHENRYHGFSSNHTKNYGRTYGGCGPRNGNGGTGNATSGNRRGPGPEVRNRTCTSACHPPDRREQ